MRQSLFTVLVFAVIGFAVVMAGAFLIYALDVMEKASSATALSITRRGTPIDDMGIAIGFVIAALGILLVCVRYACSNHTPSDRGNKVE